MAFAKAAAQDTEKPVKPVVLLVDDEENILKSLTRSLAERWARLSLQERRALAQGIQRGLDTGAGSVTKKAACSRLHLAIQGLELEC